jgi:hypothetical protein
VVEVLGDQLQRQGHIIQIINMKTTMAIRINITALTTIKVTMAAIDEVTQDRLIEERTRV